MKLSSADGVAKAKDAQIERLNRLLDQTKNAELESTVLASKTEVGGRAKAGQQV